MAMGAIPLKEIRHNGVSWNSEKKIWDYKHLYLDKWLLYTASRDTAKDGKRYYDGNELQITFLLATFKDGYLLYAANCTELHKFYIIKDAPTVADNWKKGGGLVAIRCEGVQLETLAKVLEGVILQSSLTIHSTPKEPTAEDLNYLEKLKTGGVTKEEEKESEFYQHAINGYAIPLYRDSDAGKILVIAELFLNPIDTVEKFKEAVAAFTPPGDGNSKGGNNYRGGGGYYKPEERLKFLCDALGVTSGKVQDLVRYGTTNPQQWLELQIALNVAGAYSLTLHSFPNSNGTIPVTLNSNTNSNTNGHLEKAVVTAVTVPSETLESDDTEEESDDDTNSNEEEYSYQEKEVIAFTEQRIKDLSTKIGQITEGFTFPNTLSVTTKDELVAWCQAFRIIDKEIEGAWAKKDFRKTYLIDKYGKKSIVDCTLEQIETIASELVELSALPM